MSIRRDSSFLNDVLEAARKIESIVALTSENSFLTDEVLQAAVLHHVVRDNHPEVPWQQVGRPILAAAGFSAGSGRLIVDLVLLRFEKRFPQSSSTRRLWKSRASGNYDFGRQSLTTTFSVSSSRSSASTNTQIMSGFRLYYKGFAWAGQAGPDSTNFCQGVGADDAR